METKISKLLKHLKRYTKQGITWLDALKLFWLYRLSHAIFMLKKKWHNIVTIKECKNWECYARYIYKK